MSVQNKRLLGGRYPPGLKHVNKLKWIPKGKAKLKMKRHWQHWVCKTKTNKTKTQHIMCWTLIYLSKHKNYTENKILSIHEPHKNGSERMCYRKCMLPVSLHFQFVFPFGIHLSLFTCFNIGYGYLCMREIDVSFNQLHNQSIVHFKHKHV